jgi:hypothetical protein
MSVAYGAAVLANAVFQADLRYWFIALKPMSAGQIRVFLAYLIPFALFFLCVLRSLHATLSVKTDSARAQYVVGIAALAGGFALFLLVQYGLLFGTGRMVSFYMNDPLRTIIAINFLPLMVIVAVISTFTFRRTGSYVPGASICALLVAWYVVVGQATQAVP